MSDDLVKRLRAAAKHPMMDNNCKADVFDVADAADRIEELEKVCEELEKACDEWAEVSKSNYQRARVAEAKLAKAVKALDNYSCDCGDMCEPLNGTCGGIARTTIAELSSAMKGQDDE